MRPSSIASGERNLEFVVRKSRSAKRAAQVSRRSTLLITKSLPVRLTVSRHSASAHHASHGPNQTHSLREPRRPLGPRTRATRKTETRITERENVYLIYHQAVHGAVGEVSLRAEQHGEGSTEKPLSSQS